MKKQDSKNTASSISSRNITLLHPESFQRFSVMSVLPKDFSEDKL